MFANVKAPVDTSSLHGDRKHKAGSGEALGYCSCLPFGVLLATQETTSMAYLSE